MMAMANQGPPSREHFHRPEALQLAQLSQNMASSETCEDLEPQPAYFRSSEAVMISEKIIHLSPATGKTPREEKEAVDELVVILIECMDEINTRSREFLLRKFFFEVERDERLERFIVERLKQSRVEAISQLCEKLPRCVRRRLNPSSANFDPELEVMDIDDDEQGEEDQDDNVTTRGICVSVEGFSQKLERFKIKTLDLGEAANEEERK
ncbi:uncharacterized protein LOC127789855 [Diospyros lotus]|uniref:uncharacterized protein LOC127789855 n=1 Tax=Diospyros lotus TaxID=55363 RepID=UPI002255F46D|nr:uncharacterized protein LOC127789855 [Diospyros lotus]